MARSKKTQPRAISPSLPAQQPGGLYRGAMHLENQKFGLTTDKKPKIRQLLLSETDITGDELEQEIDILGLDLTVSQDRALSALQILLDRTGYRGNLPSKEIHSMGYKWTGTLPNLSFSPDEFLEACGHQKKGEQVYQGHQAQELMKALRSLTETKRVCYVRKHWTGEGRYRRQAVDMIVWRGPILTTLEGYANLDEAEASRIIAGDEKTERASKIIVSFGPLFVDGIQDFFLLKPVMLHSEIEALYQGRRVSRTISLFIEWLLTKNTTTVKIAKDLLIEKLRMTRQVEHRHKGRVEKILQDCYEVAKKLGFLLSYEDYLGSMVFHLNPERCRRIKASAGAESDEEQGA